MIILQKTSHQIGVNIPGWRSANAARQANGFEESK